MTNHLNASTTILGFPASKLKSLLDSWSRTSKGYQQLSALSSVRLRPGIAAALLGEAWCRGLIAVVDRDGGKSEDGRIDLTHSGLALVTATGRDRTPKARAELVLGSVLQNAQALAADSLAPRKVEKIWVFGSLIDENKKDVGDIDLVVESYLTKVVPRDEIFDHVERHYPGVITDSFRHWRDRADDVFLSKTLFGKRRNPLLAPNDVHTLQDLHVPCALLFDRSRGGIIEPEYYEHHPASKRRSDHVRDKLSLPDLSPSDVFIPTPPFVVSRSFSSGISARRFAAMEISQDGDEDQFWLEDYRGGRMLVRRTFTFGEREWKCDMAILALDLPHGESEYSSHWDFNHLVEPLVSLAHADLVRLAAYREHTVSMQDIRVDIKTGGITHCPPMIKAIDNSINKAMGLEDGCPDICAAHGFGLRLTRNGNGTGYLSIPAMRSDEWEQIENLVPFALEDYLDWIDGFEPADEPVYPGYGRPLSRFL